MKASRKLSAIMFTDIEGYTALMQKSEASAIDFRNQHREIFESVTEKHQGNIVQYYGDGTLSVFESAVQAVKCASEMQQRFLEESSIPVRIGIHVGDIVVTEVDIIGDAVNLASRIESLAVAGSVLVSDKLVEELQNHNDIKVKSLGLFHFKNDKKQREVFAIDHEALVIPSRSQIKGKTKEARSFTKPMVIYLAVSWVLIQLCDYFISRQNWDSALLDLVIILAFFGLLSTLIINAVKPRLGWSAIALHAANTILAIMAVASFVLNPIKLEPSQLRLLNLFDYNQERIAQSVKSIAVLPFSNYTGDMSQDYLYAGMHEGLINELSQLSSTRITSRTSMLSYLRTTKSAKQIAKELDVDAIIEASLTRIDSVIEFRINLVNVFPNEESLWTHQYSTTLDSIPNMYKEVTKNVALKINGMLQPNEEKLLAKERTSKPGAYEAYLKGTYHAGFLTSEGLEVAKDYFTRAIDIDPEFALGYSGLALVWAAKKQMGLSSTAEANPHIKEYHTIAMQLDANNPEMWIAEAATLTWTDFDWKGGEKAFLKSIELNPNKAETRSTYAHLLLILNRFDEAREQMDLAIRLDPLNPWVLAFSGVLYFYEGKILSATKQFERLRKLEPNHPMLTRYLLNKYTNTFQYDLALKQLKKLILLEDNHEIYELIDDTYYQAGFQNMIETTASALEGISETSFIPPNTILTIYELAGDREKRIFWLKKMLDSKDPNLPYYAIRTSDPIQSDPRYIVVMKEIGLW